MEYGRITLKKNGKIRIGYRLSYHVSGLPDVRIKHIMLEQELTRHDHGTV